MLSVADVLLYDVSVPLIEVPDVVSYYKSMMFLTVIVCRLTLNAS